MTNTEFNLYPHQEEALGRLRSGSILYGDVGTGKTFTSLVYYNLNFSGKKLYVITTAKKRDSGDWEDEASIVGITDIVVDSWNNIKNYMDVKNAFFIFDEQRVVGYNTWSKTFIKITAFNKWILCSGTPGDTWSDYIPVFIANGYYRNKTDFVQQHIEYDRFSKFPKIKAYHNQGKLLKLRQNILVRMKMKRHTTRNRKYVNTEYDKKQYKQIQDTRWNPFTEQPILNASEFTSVMRRIVSEEEERQWYAKFIMSIHDRIIVYYNYIYEKTILVKICEELGKPYSMYNGQTHDDIPDTEEWIYLVQYTAGAEGWNCISTDVMMFYSLNYSFKIMEQAEGRIDRLNTPYVELEYFYLTSTSKIDTAVRNAIAKKKKFNRSAFGKEK
ncbi:MAG: hypothetical protein RR643_04855 [Anaerorhabdus sp.]|uniref:hypothetical protein n=1 Tax=Anaerorhabdus sp. TaxID=1872524 RepID=UPI002FC62003